MQQQIQFVMPAVTAGPQSQAQSRLRFAKKTQKTCGVIQISLGVAAVLIGAASIGLKAGGGMYLVGTGLWSGVFMIIAGSFGVVSAKTERTCNIIACMVMSILSTIAGVCLFALSAGSCAQDDMALQRVANIAFGQQTTQPGAAIAMDTLGILVGVAEVVFSIVQSVVCCRTTCCASNTAAPTVIFIQQPYPEYPMMNFGYAGQAAVVPGPVVTPASGASSMMKPPAYSQVPSPPPPYH